LPALLPWVLLAQAAFADTVIATRVWPAPDATRITLESREALRFNQFSLDNPARLVIDLEGVELNAALQSVIGQVQAQDRFIAGIRLGRPKAGVTRVVIDLKQTARANVFTLRPMEEYGHRLVIDLLPSGTVVAAAGETSTAAPPAPVEAAPIPPASTAAAPHAGARLASLDPAPARGQVPRAPAAPGFNRLVTIAIDAGHGGVDPGAIGASGTYEKHVTLAIARRLKTHIDRQENMRAVLIRDGDYFIPLHERVHKARRVQADLFVSIHADAFMKPSARGSSVFALSESGATSAAARWLAKRENDADLIGGVNLNVKDAYLRQTLLDLSQTATINDSLRMGREVLREIGAINDLHKPRVEQAGFAVLRAPDIPSILVETAFISNPDEEKRLNDEEYQERMAAAIAAGLSRYLEQNPLLARKRLASTL